MLNTRTLGYTGEKLTTVGLGTWAIGGPWEFGWGPQDDDQAVRTIITAMENGVNWLDTAPIYGCGHSEELVGKALKQINPKPFVATKCGLLWDDQRKKHSCLKADSIQQECENSLRRLDIDVIDLYQIHHPTPDEDIEEAFEQMARLKDQGKVRYIGVSNFSVQQLERVRKIHPIASLQPHYHMVCRDIEDEIIPYCKEHQIGLITYCPLHRGLLTGKFSKEHLANLPEDDHRKKSDDFQEPYFSSVLQLVERLKPIANDLKITLPQLAIAWVLRRPEVTAAIVGARKPSQIEETHAAANIQLGDDVIKEIEKLLEKRKKLKAEA